ncbi:MAG: branched-chain amino acid transport system substrate-binding protein [Solirubrobacteraceae bacterium]|nr:branched-chain amino acid transport system substrate-binding protein [Solirubrobacteraceae bacterium]
MKDWMRPARLATLMAAFVLSLAFAACGDEEGSSSSGGGGADGSANAAAGGTTPDETKCGEGTGEKATGEPIVLGGLVTKIPGVDFTDGSDAAVAYFKCVNDNGGVKGRPIKFIDQQHGSDPQQVASLATKLAETDKVLAFVSGFSILDCPVNKDFYKKNGFNVILAGVPNDCFQSSNIAALNMGPGYSGLGAASYLARKGAKSIVAVSPKQPGYEAVHEIMLSDARKRGLKAISRLETVPISDPGSLVQALVAQAGEGGGVVLDFTPPEGVKILQAAAQQGVIDKVMWGASTPLNDASVPDAIGDQWDGKVFVNAELAMLDSDGPDMQLYRAVAKKYDSGNPLGSFGQMGFVAAKMTTDTLLELPEDQLTKQGINKAIGEIKNYKTDVLCKPWYFQDMKLHVPNNTDRTVTTKDGKIIEAEGCVDIPATYPDLEYVRQFEKENEVNKG